MPIESLIMGKMHDFIEIVKGHVAFTLYNNQETPQCDENQAFQVNVSMRSKMSSSALVHIVSTFQLKISCGHSVPFKNKNKGP